MGFLGKLVGGITKGLGKIAGGIMKFAKSPLGKMVFQVGLGLLTGGVGGVAAKLLSGPLSKIGSSLLGKVAGPLINKFLGSAGSLLSGNGMNLLQSLVSKAGNAGDLLGIAKNLMSARQSAPQTDPTTNEMANLNIAQLLAFQQAQQYRSQQA